MKTILQYSAIFVLITLSGNCAIASHDDYSKVIKKEFAVNPDAKFIIENKFGEVHIDNWQQNSISITVTISAECSSESAAARILDKISVTMNGTASQVDARTVFEDSENHGRNKKIGRAHV